LTSISAARSAAAGADVGLEICIRLGRGEAFARRMMSLCKLC
jgi:hypothetical protein